MVTITGGILEEKLYFRPANYGKGLRKHKEKPASAEKQTDNKESHCARNLVLFLLLLTIIIAVIVWLLRGKTTTSGQYPENERSQSLICIANNFQYEKTNRIDSDDKELKITAVFRGATDLSSLSLKYTLNFSNKDEAVAAEAKSHAQFGLELQDLGYNPGEFNNKFSIIDDSLVITLSIDSRSSIDETSKSYFLIGEKTTGGLPATLFEYQENYEKQGFSCKPTANNN